MSNFLSKITPLTKGLIWLSSSEITPEVSFYKDIDYLLNGLLTATIKNSTSDGSHVFVSENFGNSFYVIVGNQVNEKELKNYFELIKPQLNDESNIILIDEINQFDKIQKIASDLKSKIQKI